MKAIVYHEYGTPDRLGLEEVPEPEMGGDDVLIRVHASSVNSWDWDLLRGTPFMNRLPGVVRPRHEILGADVAGRVEAVGADVDRFGPGDEVYGDLSHGDWGCFAEYVCADQAALAPKPADLSFEEAAAVPQAGGLALQGLRRGGPIEAGRKVLINGAGGGVGTFAVQIAKSYGAEVTGVDSAGKLDVVASLGADHVVDNRQEDFTRTGIRYDRILDTTARHSVFDYRRALSPEGVYVMVGGATSRILQTMVMGPVLSVAGGPKITILMHRPRGEELEPLTAMLEAGTVAPVIDRRFGLAEVPDALAYFGDGTFIGKIGITV
jgi:NADPH:quinone reductase-like Zn-dependent oxidoreductase